jgi:hypothetical protein
MSRLNTARPSSTRTYRPPRQTSGPPSKPPRAESANRARQTDPIPGRGGPERRRRPRTEGTGAGHDRGRPGPRWVRTPSKPLVRAGQQRARSADKNRSSHAIHRSGLGRSSSSGPGSNPSLNPPLWPHWGRGRSATPGPQRASAVRRCSGQGRCRRFAAGPWTNLPALLGNDPFVQDKVVAGAGRPARDIRASHTATAATTSVAADASSNGGATSPPAPARPTQRSPPGAAPTACRTSLA